MSYRKNEIKQSRSRRSDSLCFSSFFRLILYAFLTPLFIQNYKLAVFNKIDLFCFTGMRLFSPESWWGIATLKLPKHQTVFLDQLWSEIQTWRGWRMTMTACFMMLTVAFSRWRRAPCRNLSRQSRAYPRAFAVVYKAHHLLPRFARLAVFTSVARLGSRV
jgi:hypothetical protein